MNESLTYADAHPDEVRAILRTYTKIDAEDPRGADPAEVAHRDQPGLGARRWPSSARRTASSPARRPTWPSSCRDDAHAGAWPGRAPAVARLGAARRWPGCSVRLLVEVLPRARPGRRASTCRRPADRCAALVDEARHAPRSGRRCRRHPDRPGRSGWPSRWSPASLVGLRDRRVPVLRAATASTIEFLRPIPSVALIPLAVLLYGTDLRLDPAAGGLRRVLAGAGPGAVRRRRRRPGRRRDRPLLPARPAGPGPARHLADRAAVRVHRHPAGRVGRPGPGDHRRAGHRRARAGQRDRGRAVRRRRRRRTP